ncbi:polysaccharide deacetylase family protein [Algibacter miyuki]|uniref:Polysaccharide deacetylase family protein n=1 Tax=Algibacter miyuki TaxID=1306933 RepID=A0ABV5GVI9_9FLAO|nr:polysaccharide deacetylase family protein [Algibacter miyuki]MDN3664853.1 polysaccharide deacetylase family protein [Algibacter miyuki]
MLKFKNINGLFIILGLALLLCNTFITVPIYVFIALFFCWFIITSIGSFNITWNYHLEAFNSKKNHKEKQIAITFDDGPNSDFTPKILDLLKKHNAKATFFCIGKQIKNHPEIIKQISAAGHSIGNHTYSHAQMFDFYGKQKVIDEINKTDALISSILNKKMNLFRPPYGVTNRAITKALKQTRHHVIGWNIRSLDTVKTDEKAILDRIIKNITPGSVILLHDSKEITVRVLEQLLLFLQENDYQAITVDALFNIEAYA